MAPDVVPQIGILAAGGIAGGLVLLVRGIGSHGTGTRLADTGTSPIASLAAGEVRVSGVVEPAEVTLVSLLQSAPCVFYRARIGGQDEPGGADPMAEERAVGFRVRDTSGSIRVFPRGALFDVPDRLDATNGAYGDLSPSVRLRTGPAIGSDAATIHRDLDPLARFGRAASSPVQAGRRFREARIEPGDIVTVLGRALPFGQLDDPDGADVAVGTSLAPDDPEVAADLAAARAAGLLTDPTDAWGNAAIAGFGIGRPTRAPELDPAATALPVASAAEAALAARTFDIEPDALVLAGTVDVPLLVAAGGPGAAVARHASRFLVGILGAVLAIVSAVVLALALSGGLDAVLRPVG